MFTTINHLDPSILFGLNSIIETIVMPLTPLHRPSSLLPVLLQILQGLNQILKVLNFGSNFDITQEKVWSQWSIKNDIWGLTISRNIDNWKRRKKPIKYYTIKSHAEWQLNKNVYTNAFILKINELTPYKKYGILLFEHCMYKCII